MNKNLEKIFKQQLYLCDTMKKVTFKMASVIECPHAVWDFSNFLCSLIVAFGGYNQSTNSAYQKR